MNNSYFLKKARTVSKLSDYKHHHIGCVLVWKGQIVSVGFNTNRTHPLQAEYNRFRKLTGTNVIHKAHAEILCLNKAMKLDISMSECTLYIYRELKSGIFATAHPCPACYQMIKDCGVKRIVYTCSGYFESEIV